VLELPPGVDARSVRAVAMDLDGTVLDETFQPSRRTADAIALAESSGIACLIATGRMFVSARRVAEKLGIERPLVCYQGALVADPLTGEVLVHRPIEAPLAQEILRAMPEEHARRSNLYVDDELYVWEENEETLRYSQVAGVPLHIVGNLARWIERPTTKIVTVGTPGTMDTLRDQMQPRFGSRAFVAKSLPYFLEFAAPGVSKASGLALVADLLGFTAEQAVAVGDAENDREMLDWAGCGLAVANADERLQGEADAVIPSVHDDGVAQLLEALADARGATRETI
jgi:Cof subfamily protein (haloacid dehalogenase superfamily)